VIYIKEDSNMFRGHYYEHERHSRSRLFEKGDLKYVILDLLKDKPTHGYEIIRALEERFHGFYSPSAGSVYPTLQLLEDMGYLQSNAQDGKKVYTITEEGKKFLEDREKKVDEIKGHMRDWSGGHREEFRDIANELRDMASSLRRRARQLETEKLSRIKDIIVQTSKDIDSVLRE
jgi:DNA-binding PadR family transcriptional regulator